MGHIGVNQKLKASDINNIESFTGGRLAEITNGQQVRIYQLTLAGQFLLSLEGIHQGFFFQTKPVKIATVVKEVGLIFR